MMKVLFEYIFYHLDYFISLFLLNIYSYKENIVLILNFIELKYHIIR